MLNLNERVILSWGSPEGGPMLCFLGGVHGNEPAGVLALERVLFQLQELTPPFRGHIIGLRGNLRALAQQQRFVEVDLNRLWSREHLDRIKALPEAELRSEELELLELLQYLEAVQEAPFHPQYFVDLHTTSALGGAFSVVATDPAQRALAECIPVPMVFGLAPALAHTTNRFFEERGLIGIAYESGQHDEPVSVNRHEAAIWILLEAVGCMRREDVPDWDRHRQVLRDAAEGGHHYQNVAYRHGIEGDDEFRMIPGFKNFQEVYEGQPLGYDLHGEIIAPMDGRILMPLYQPQGDDGFFIIQPLQEPPV